ncbi:transcriptional regulator family: Fungal Specific TF [Aspergillus niger]|nr:transcriptional regulator family: Fungal Specific TF [Aspergillus niger]
MRSHFGCVTCRQRKVKCNEERPICGPCAKSSRDCVFSDCIFRHYSASDLAGDETGYATQTWVKVPSDLVFFQVKDPFADDEEPTFLLEKHRSITATPITPASEQEVIARSAHSSALPTGNGVLTAILIRHFKEGPSQWLDCFDTNAYYSIKVPVMVATRPMLKAAACALAAKHLHRMCQGDARRMLQLTHLRNSPLQWAVAGIDLKYESIINFITSGDGINPGDYESPPGQRPCFGTTQEDLLERWKLLEFELTAWNDTLPDSFKPCGRTQLFLSNLDPTHQEPIPTPTENVGDADTIDAISFIIPMCAVTIQTYHMGRILLLSNMPQESTAIRSTVTARLRHYRQIAGLVGCLAMSGPAFYARWGAFFSGVMDTGIIGSVVVMDQFKQKFGSFSSIVHGLIVSSILIPAAFSSFFGGKLADWIGRPKSITIGALIFGIGCAIEAGAVHLAMFIVGRVVEGLGEGLYLGTLVVYICEISPPSQRGPLTTGPQLLITMGLVVGFFTCYGCEKLHSSMAWRTPFTVLACISIAFSLAAFLWLIDSPRWLTLHNRVDDATRAWEYLQVSEADREELLEEEEQVDVHEEALTHPLAPTGSILAPNTLDQVVSRHSRVSHRTKPKGIEEATLFDAFKPDVRNRTLLGLFLMGMQQLAGIDGVLYYAPMLFEQAGMTSSQASFLASGVSGIVIFVVTIPALIYADSWGRRSNVILGGLGLTITMFVIGSLYAADAVHHSTGAGRWVVIVAIYLFAAIYSVSWGVSCKVYAAEIQPQRTRASATCLAHGSNWVSNFFVALITPVLLAKSSCAAYFLFGGCTALTIVVCGFWMPETKGRSLEEVERCFVRGKENT